MLSQDEKRILLAKHFGWTDIHGGPPEGGMFWRGANPKRPLGLKEEIPDYFNDLNACHEAEKTILPAHGLRYSQALFDICNQDTCSSANMLHATAIQRAEVLGQILNLW